MAQSPLEAQYAALLARIVTDDGLVRYELLAGDELRQSLDAVVTGLGLEPLPAESDAKARMALWINAYNANALRMALEESHREGFTSVRDVPGFFDQRAVVVAGETLTLDALLERIRALGDPRIHSAIVYGARGCPSLRTEAFTAGRIDAQLDEQTRSWLDDPSRNRLMPDGIHVSSVFERYASDFDVEPYKGVNGFVRRYTRPAGTIRDYMRNVKDVMYRYIPLNWALNDADTPPGPLAPPAARAPRPSDSQPASP